MFNRIILIGRLTKDPELRYTPSTGTAFTNFTIAVDRPFSSNKKEKETDFIKIVVWGKLAEQCKTYLAKGGLVAVDGRLQIRNWETSNGERRTTTEVRADVVRFIGRRTPDAEPSGERAPEASHNSEEQYNLDDVNELDEDIFDDGKWYFS